MITRAIFIALLISNFVSANENVIESVTIGNIEVVETENKLKISFNNYPILELDNMECGLCGGTYILHSPNKEDIQWIESGYPLVDNKVLSGVDLKKIKPYINPANDSRKIIGFFQAGSGASGKSGGNTSYHIDIESGVILENTFTYDYYRKFLGFFWPFEETVIKEIKPRSAI